VRDVVRVGVSWFLVRNDGLYGRLLQLAWGIMPHRHGRGHGPSIPHLIHLVMLVLEMVILYLEIQHQKHH